MGDVVELKPRSVAPNILRLLRMAEYDGIAITPEAWDEACAADLPSWMQHIREQRLSR